MIVDYITITVFYEYTGFAIPVDAVVYASQATELRTEGMYRPRIPPARSTPRLRAP